MSEKEKQRGSNYSVSDKNLLLDCVVDKLSVIENKKTDGTSAHSKDEAWVEIGSNYNSRTTTAPRTVASLRKCYDNLKKNTRKRAGDERVEIFKTGGGRPKISKDDFISERVRSIIEPTINPLPCKFDSDASYIATTERIQAKPSSTITSATVTFQHDPIILTASADDEGHIYFLDEEILEPASHCQATGLEDDDEYRDLIKEKKPSDWTQGTPSNLREPVNASLLTNARNRRRTPVLRRTASAETTQKFAELAVQKLELTRLNLIQVKEQNARLKVQGDLKEKILEVELSTKQAILDQELLKLNRLREQMANGVGATCDNCNK